MNTLASPHYTTQALSQLGLLQADTDQLLPDMMVFASDVLCPKNFRTGKLTKTGRTVSIHHFSASWVDEKIKAELAHQQKLRDRFGKRLGGYVLIAESVMEKYSPVELVTKLPLRAAKKAKAGLLRTTDAAPWYGGLVILIFN